MNQDPISVELWTWSSVFRKWFKFEEVLESDDDIDSWISDILREEIENDVSTADGATITKLTSIRIGDARAGYATVYSAALAYDEENYDTGNYHPMKARSVAIINVSMPARKFIQLKKTMKDLVASGSFGLGRGRN